MSTSADADLTLPSVRAALPGEPRAQRLLLTIIFHPDPHRIGACAQVPGSGTELPWVLGRYGPTFFRSSCDGDQQDFSLDEPHVSRRALTLQRAGNQVIFRRPADSSRCRVGGKELVESAAFCPDELRRGVPIMLAHSVVLLLRSVDWVEPVSAVAPIPELCGSSAYMLELREQIGRLGRSGLDVLVRGETGTGKELVATALHRASQRSTEPLVTVNMAALPADLAAAALFGSTRGAYTGAIASSEGYFRQAHGGTLFMDEIGDAPSAVQPQLLRALQEREIQTVGGGVHTVDVRVISATDALLEEGCDFKAALRHRLGVCEINLLPLREHPEDIGELLRHFLVGSSKQIGGERFLPGAETGAREIAAWAELFHKFLLYSWPGNIRELANFSSQVVLASAECCTLPENVRSAFQDSAGGAINRRGRARSRRRSMRDISAGEFDTALRKAEYEVAHVARHLGVSRQAIYRRMYESPHYRLAREVPLAELEDALAVREGDAAAAAMDLKVSRSSLRSRLRDSSLTWF